MRVLILISSLYDGASARQHISSVHNNYKLIRYGSLGIGYIGWVCYSSDSSHKNSSIPFNFARQYVCEPPTDIFTTWHYKPVPEAFKIEKQRVLNLLL